MPSKPPIVIGKPRVLARWGNSPAVHLSREALAAAGVDERQAFTLQASRGRITLVFEERKPAAQALEQSSIARQQP